MAASTMNATGPTVGDTHDMGRERIKECARAHDRLDTYGVPRFVRGHWYELEERIVLLIDRCTAAVSDGSGPVLVPGPAESGWTPESGNAIGAAS